MFTSPKIAYRRCLIAGQKVLYYICNSKDGRLKCIQKQRLKFTQQNSTV